MERSFTNRIFFAIIMALFTTTVVTGVVIVYNLGFGPGFFRIWGLSFLLAYIIVVPFILIVGPLVQRLVDVIIISVG
ncbi:MAG: DUF2798 domain-containing protein [Gammaproteobacteria bacterium]